ncbi:hypothetical protein BaRGS_00011120 [Batillaria attramentaria]|uniref:Uncharacterized protein n=1 Tax=Batillaria attramentaria TaxID=370345 RepID=A0ABD0LEH4_9CAEN
MSSFARFQLLRKTVSAWCSIPVHHGKLGVQELRITSDLNLTKQDRNKGNIVQMHKQATQQPDQYMNFDSTASTRVSEGFLGDTEKKLEHPARPYSKCIGFWTSEIGGISEAVQIWEYGNIQCDDDPGSASIHRYET